MHENFLCMKLNVVFIFYRVTRITKMLNELGIKMWEDETCCHGFEKMVNGENLNLN